MGFEESGGFPIPTFGGGAFLAPFFAGPAAADDCDEGGREAAGGIGEAAIDDSVAVILPFFDGAAPFFFV